MTSGRKRTGWVAVALGVTAVACGLVLGDVVDPDRATAVATVAGAGIAAAVHLHGRGNSNSPADSGDLDASADERP
jgi:hypothetical protein